MFRRAPLPSYFGLTFLFTWSLLPTASTSIPASLVALCGPAVAAFVVAASTGGEAWRRFSLRMTHWRIPVHWYLLALLLPIPITALRSGFEYVWGARGAIEVQPISALGLIVFVLVAGEEAGWRGFALPRLLPRFGPLGASIVIGTIWAVWHLPLFRMPGMPQFGSPFPPFIAYTIALSVILTFLASRTQGSVVIATAFHGAVNTFGVVNTAAGPGLRGWSNALSYGLAALLIAAAAWQGHSAKAVKQAVRA
jgi:membrane protease YdiL (CAAX protease family)